MWMMWMWVTEALAQEPVEGPSLKQMARPICAFLLRPRASHLRSV